MKAGTIGEMHSPETHLIPSAFEAIRGQRPALEIFGDKYPTPDGTCVRDYIHVSDLAEAHVWRWNIWRAELRRPSIWEPAVAIPSVRFFPPSSGNRPRSAQPHGAAAAGRSSGTGGRSDSRGEAAELESQTFAGRNCRHGVEMGGTRAARSSELKKRQSAIDPASRRQRGRYDSAACNWPELKKSRPKHCTNPSALSDTHRRVPS